MKLHYFEIPTRNIDRAQEFYESVFFIDLIEKQSSYAKEKIFSTSEDVKDAYGALVQDDFHVVSEEGVLIYFSVKESLDSYVKRIEHLGGKLVTQPKQVDGGEGMHCVFRDTEGNRIGLYSAN